MALHDIVKAYFVGIAYQEMYECWTMCLVLQILTETVTKICRYRLYNRHYEISAQETGQVTSLYLKSFGWRRSDGIVTG